MAYRQVLANEATASKRRVFFQLCDATDGITAETGEAGGQPQVSDDGAAWTNTGIGTLSSVGSGEYSADLTQTIVATAGHFIRTRYKSANTAEARGTEVQVMGYDPSAALATAAALATVQADTDDIQTRLPAALVGGRMDSSVGAITAAAVTSIRALASGTSDSGTTTTMVDAARTEADDDYWKGDVILFTSGNIAGQARVITAFKASTDTITFDRATTQAVATQNYEILPGESLDALIALRLEQLITEDSTGSPAFLDSFLQRIMNADSSNTFDPGTDSLEAIRDTFFGTSAGSAAANFANVLLDKVYTSHVSTNTVGELLNALEGSLGNLASLVSVTISSWSAVAAAGSTSTVIRTNRTEADDYWNGQTLVLFDSGGSGEWIARRIADYSNANGAFTVTEPFPFGVIVGQAVRVIIRVASTSASIGAGAVWDEARASHVTAGSFGEGMASVQGNVTGSVASVGAGGIAAATFAAGAIDANAIATDAIGSAELAASAVTEIQSGLATSAALALVQADTDDIQTRLPAALVSGRMDSSVGVMAAGVVTAAAVATNAIDADALAADAFVAIADGVWDEALAGHLAPGSTGEALSNAATGGSALTAQQVRDAMKLAPTAGAPAVGSIDEAVDTLQLDTDDIQTRLPAALVGGRMDSSVGAMANDVVTAAAIATDAIGSAELAASAVTEIQTGLATSAALAVVQADTDDIQARLPATLSGGRMRSQVEGMDAGTVTAAAVATDAIDSDAIAASAVTEIQTGLATAASVAAVQADTDDIQARLPAALVGGRMDSSVGAMAAGVVTAAAIATNAIDADALATDAVTEITAAVDAQITASHGVGSYVDTGGSAPSAATIADAVWDEVLAGHLTPGSTGAALNDAAAGGAGLTPQQVRDALKLAPSAGAPAAGSIDEEIDSLMGPGFNSATDSNEEIRDRIDECCAAGATPGSSVNIEGI